MVYRRPKVFGRSWRFLTFGFAFGCQRSTQLKAKGLAEGWNFWNSVNLSANFQKPMSEYAHQILKYKIPNLRLHLWLRLRGPKFFYLRLWLRPKKSPSVDRWIRLLSMLEISAIKISQFLEMASNNKRNTELSKCSQKKLKQSSAIFYSHYCFHPI